jgi:GNAT superfamily N-acetyltransferase
MKSLGGSGTTSPAPHKVADIRALERSDLAGATALFDLVMGSPGRPAVAEFFQRTLFESPWADPELPSLVAIDDRGRLVGFLGAEVRRMRFGEHTARVVWCQHFVVDPAARRLGAGALLLRRMFKGAQDATLTDNGSDVVRQMWVGLGGQALHLKDIHWVRLFRPWSVAAYVAAGHARPRLRAALRRIARPLDAATAAAAARHLEPASVNDAATPLTPRTLLDAMPAVSKRLTLYPDYDEGFLEWLFEELVKVGRRGRLVAKLVHAEGGRTLGWYVYYLRPGWRSEVLQVAAAAERDVGRVLDHLLSHAHAHGSAAVRGRLEPDLVEAVVRRRCLLWHRGGALAHSLDPQLLLAMHSEKALVTRLEGEWWGDTLI